MIQKGGVAVNFKIKQTKEKEECTYKTVYLKQKLVDEIEKLAIDNKTSFNNVVISMIEACLGNKLNEYRHSKKTC